MAGKRFGCFWLEDLPDFSKEKCDKALTALVVALSINNRKVILNEFLSLANLTRT